MATTCSLDRQRLPTVWDAAWREASLITFPSVVARSFRLVSPLAIRGRYCKQSSVSQSVIWRQVSERGGWNVRARALTCVALGRWVAFGRPKMSVWGRAGAGSAPAKVACNTQFAHPNLELIWFFSCWNILDFFCFRRKELRTNHSHLCSLDTQWRLSIAHQRALPRAHGHPHARPR